MTESDQPMHDPQRHDDDTDLDQRSHVAREVSLLDCWIAESASKTRRQAFTLTLGGSDGAIDAVAMSRRDAKLLLRYLLISFRAGGAFGAPHQIITKFCVPHSVWRSELGIDIPGCMDALYEDLLKKMPEVARHVSATIASVETWSKRHRCTPSATRALISLVRKALLIGIDAARSDT